MPAVTTVSRACQRSMWLCRLLAPVDAAWLVFLRVAFGLILFASMLRILITRSLTYSFLDDYFVRSNYHFKYWGFAWVQAPPGNGIYVLVASLAGLSLAVAAGFCFRVAAAALTLGFVYFQLIDATLFVNHYYLMALLGGLLTVSPAGRLWSVDAGLRKRSTSTVSAAWLYLFRFQFGVVWTFAAVAKAQPDWLVHAQPLRIWLGPLSDMPIVGQLFLQPWAALVLSWAGFLFDASIPWLLPMRRVRPFAFAAVLLFHTTTFLLFPRIIMFPVIMIVGALLFFAPDWPRVVLAKLFLLRPHAHATKTSCRAQASHIHTRRSALSLAFAAAYCMIHVLLPLRFLLYGGDVRWHEQGLRFSWRVLHREKRGSVTFQVRSKTTTKVWTVRPEQYISNPYQVKEMTEQPDLILQCAHFIASDFARRGLGRVEVRAEAWNSLNGRPNAMLIDPQVDLTQVDDGLRRATWILPAPTTPPPDVRGVL